MQTIDRPMLMRQPMSALKTMIRQMGADSPQGETKESLIHRILLFKPQQPTVLIKPVLKPVEPLTPDEITKALLPFINNGLEVKYDETSWTITHDKRTDSGSLCMPLKSIVRCAQYLMRVAV